MIRTDNPPIPPSFSPSSTLLNIPASSALGAEVFDSSPALTFSLYTHQVRTKDHRFESVSHLISYHVDNHLPIISAGSELCLQQPVERKL